MSRQSISNQYISKDKINVTILDMINPAHFVVKESPDLLNASSKAKKFLEAEEAMQKYYASVEPCFFQLPLKDAIIVVLHKEKFYRAKVIRILTLSAGHLFRVYLVDYGIECSIPRENIYEIEKDFLQHPFQAANLKLLGIEPISLIMNKIDLTISYGPVSDWDQSATLYVKDLLKNMCSVYIEVQGTDDFHIYGRLYICYESSPTKCINDELVSKSFAQFNEDCWKNVIKIENILDGSNNNNVASVQPDSSMNVNPEQVPCSPNLPEAESSFEDFTMKFINPSDGKIVAESTLTKENAETSLVDEEFKLQNELVQEKKVVPDLHKDENKSSSNVEEIVIETEAQKHFQKLLNKKKYKSPNKRNSTDNAVNKNLQETAANKTVENPTIPCKISHINSYTSEIHSQNSIADNTVVNHSVIEDTKDLKISSPDKIDSYSNNQNVENYKTNLNNGSPNQSELIKSCVRDLSSPESKEAASEEKSDVGNMSQDYLIAEKRLMRLQRLKRKQLSPGSSTNKDHDVMKTSDELENTFHDVVKIQEDISHKKIEISHEHLNDTFPDENCQTQPSVEIIQESSISFSGQENESVGMSENLRQLQKLQRKVRLKKKKDSLEAIEKISTEDSQFEEISVNTSCGSSLCDSDSGLNSYSSSPSPSDRVRSCCLL